MLSRGKETPKLMVSASDDQAMFSLMDGNLKRRWHFVLKEGDVEVSLYDKDGEVIWSAP